MSHVKLSIKMLLDRPWSKSMLRMCNKYAKEFTFAASSQDILDAFANNKTACLIGVEGGHSIDSSMGTLRTMYQLGVRYLTLTHSCSTPWADNWLVDTGSDPVKHNGLSAFGKRLIGEMNRMGMMVDLAHVPEQVMNQVLEISKAPVIFSHSSAYSICPHKRNVPDYILQKVKDKNGIVMVNFYNEYVTCGPKTSISNVADHFDHIKKEFGSSIVGFGGDYDSVDRLPTGLEDVSKYPDLVAELLKRGWTDDEVKDALGRNLIRVFKAVEAIRDSQNSTAPDDIPIPLEQVQNQCRTDYGYLVQPNAAAMTTHCLMILVSTPILYLLIDKLI